MSVGKPQRKKYCMALYEVSNWVKLLSGESYDDSSLKKHGDRELGQSVVNLRPCLAVQLGAVRLTSKPERGGSPWRFPSFSGYFFTKTLHNDISISTNPTKTDLSQPGKVVLITGAGRGIGRSTALRYAESGIACILVCARTGSELDTLETEIKNINSSIRVRKFSIDICNKAQVTSVLKTLSEEEGKLNILVNNAGTSCAWTPVADSDEDTYWETFHVNVKETAKKEDTSLDVVNLTTIGANITVPGSSAYGVSKLAISRLTEFVTLEYGQQGVNCFAVHPGGVPTTLAKGIALPEYVKAL
ncbi:hypothetical protein V1506DRAFT_523817 [Lipomyces tetrasporus]